MGPKGCSLIVGLHFVTKKRPGKPPLQYVYAWRGGPLIAKREGGGRPVLSAAEIKAALEAIERNATPDGKTLSALVREWERSPSWSNLATSTQKTWASYVKQIVERWGQTPLSVWNDPRMKAKVVRWRDERAATPRGADLGVMVLRELLKFGCLHGRVLINVAEGIPTLYRNGQRAEIIWTDEDIDRFAFEAKRMDKLHVLDGLRLCAVTGLRREDLVTVSRSDVYDFAIVKRALKTSRGRRRTASMPRIPELDLLLQELDTRQREEGVTTLLVNSRGKPWSGDGFGGSFNRVRDAAGIVFTDPDTGEQKRKHLHDVRGTFATRLILSGLTDAEVAEIMAWSVEKVSGIRRTYVDQSRAIVAIGERIMKAGVN